MIVDNASVPPTEQANGGPIRRLISLVLATGLTCAGLYIIADITIFVGPMLVIGALFIATGGAWLWEDFIAPHWPGPQVG
jgi:hypothetical protein